MTPEQYTAPSIALLLMIGIGDCAAGLAGEGEV